MRTRALFRVLSSVGVSRVIVFLNRIDMVEVKELLELQSRELLNSYRFNGNAVANIKGSVLKALDFLTMIG